MVFVATTWTYQEVISSAKLQQMSDNDDALKARLDASLPFAMKVWTGSFVMTGTSGTFPVVIPAGFTVVPHLMPSVDSAGVGVILIGKATTMTAGTCYYSQGANGVALPYRIMALQMTPTTANS